MGLFEAAHRCGCMENRSTPWNISHISYNDETCHSYTSPKEDPKNKWITWHSSGVLLTSAFFHKKSASFDISRNTDRDCVLIYNF